MGDSVDLSRFILFSFVSLSFFFASGFSFLFNGVFWGVVFSLREKVFDSPEHEHCHLTQ